MKNVYIGITGKYEKLFNRIQNAVGLSQKYVVLESLIACGLRLGIIKDRDEFIASGLE